MKYNNFVLLEGRLTADVDLKETKNGNKYSRFCLCYNVYRYDKNNKDPNYKGDSVPHYFNIVAWNDIAEFAAELKKGEAIQVRGKLSYSAWTDENNNKHSDVFILAESVINISNAKKTDKVEEISEELENEISEAIF